jgi:hypothetical protein
MHREKYAGKRKPESVVDDKSDHGGFLCPSLFNPKNGSLELLHAPHIGQLACHACHPFWRLSHRKESNSCGRVGITFSAWMETVCQKGNRGIYEEERLDILSSAAERGPERIIREGWLRNLRHPPRSKYGPFDGETWTDEAKSASPRSYETTEGWRNVTSNTTGPSADLLWRCS